MISAQKAQGSLHESEVKVLLGFLTVCLVNALFFAPLPSLSIAVSFALLAAGFAVLQLVKPPHILILRMILLIVPGFLPPLVLILGGPGRVFAVHAIRYQTLSYASIILSLTSLSFAAAILGWRLGSMYPKPKRAPSPPTNASTPAFVFYAAMALFAASQTARSLGPFIWQASYASTTRPTLLGIGVFPAIVGIAIVCMYLELSKFRPQLRLLSISLFAAVTIYSLFFCLFFRGMRLEVMACFMAIGLIELDRRKIRISIMTMVTLGGIAFLFAQAWGIYRSSAATGMSIIDAFHHIGASSSAEFLDVSGQQLNLLSVGTVSDISATFFNSVGLLHDGYLTPLLGSSYFDFIPRTLPQFIFPGRPTDLSWLFSATGRTSGGGIFELAEAYLNFGVFGCLLIPALITFLISYLWHFNMRHPSVACEKTLAIVSLLLVRGVWYQTFSLYKGLVVYVLLEVMAASLLIVVRIFKTLFADSYAKKLESSTG